MHTSVTNCLLKKKKKKKKKKMLRFRLIFNEIIGLNIDFAQLRPERRNQLLVYIKCIYSLLVLRGRFVCYHKKRDVLTEKICTFVCSVTYKIIEL